PTFLKKHTRGQRISPFFSAVNMGTAVKTTAAKAERDASMSKSAGDTGALTLSQRLAKVAPNQRRALVVTQIREDAARVLGLSASATLPNNKPLNELGLDSLMAVEMRNALGAAVG